MKDAAIYGCLLIRVNQYAQGIDRVSFPFSDLDTVDQDNHVEAYDSQKLKAFDYWHGGHLAAHAKMYVPTRGITLSSYAIGEQAEDNPAHQAIQRLIVMNASLSEEEQGAPYLEVAHTKVFPQIPGRVLLSVDIKSSQPKFLLMTRDVPIYFLAFRDANSMYLAWSNEASLEDRLRESYGNRFVYFRMKPMMNGTCVIQSHYLKSKLTRWSKDHVDALSLLNFLETYLFRRSIVQPLM